MTYSEYINQDAQLMQQIADFRIRNCELKQEIAVNNQRIEELQYERARLMVTFDLESENK